MSVVSTVLSGRGRFINRKTLPYVFLVPFFVVFVSMYLYPIVWAGWLSFHEFGAISSTFVGLENYRRVFFGGQFYDALIVTGLVGVFAIPIQVVVSMVVAVMLNARITQARKALRTGYLIPYVVSPVVLAALFGLFLENSGLVNAFLQSVAGVQIPWLVDPLWAKISVIIVHSWRFIGFFVVLYLAGLQAIPGDLYRAAKIDGAGRIQQFWHVTVPQLRPITLLVGVISTVYTLKLFDIPFVLTNGGPGSETTTAIVLLYNQAFQNFNLGYASAIALVFAIMLATVLMIQFRIGGARNV